ncbi:MAG: hypothetical protein IBV52_09255 [Candidatus Bathyarchaeota archaeon]
MPNKSRWESDFWKLIVTLSVILTIIVSILQIGGMVNFWNLLILPLYNFFTISIPLYSVPLSVIGTFIVLIILTQSGSDILDNYYVRNLAIDCKKPRTTDHLKKRYEELHRQKGTYGGYTFEDCLKLLEKRDLLTYQNGDWEVTDKALSYIKKYHG